MSTKTQQKPTSTPEAPASSSCYRKKQEASAMFENLVGWSDAFVHASVDEHKACFKNTIQKVNEMSKAIKERILMAKKLSCNKCSLFGES